jgi:predicted P-loop ATPase
MADEFDIDKHINDPQTKADLTADAEQISRRKASPSIVPLDEERQRRKRSGTAGTKRAAGNDGIQWPDVTEHGGPKKTCANARVAVEALGVSCRYDEFHDCVTITRAPISAATSAPEGDALDHLSGANVDHAGHLLRVAMHATFCFDPGKDHVHDALIQLALTHRFDPLRDYLDGLRWDGTRRLDTWLTVYLSAEDTPLNQWFGRLTLVAAVRRVRQPGCKFDHIPVFEGAEGTQKSGTIQLLALDPRNFSDQTILGLSDRQQQELLRGKWLYEIAEMQGMKRADVDHVKAFASRTYDRARPAYGRSLIDQPRRCVFIGTTNNDTYLKSQTGNRRFWPVKTGIIHIDALRRDRDQLWAEAASVEASGLSLVLPRELWEQAKIEQDARLEHDPWMDLLESIEDELTPSPLPGGGHEYRISTKAIFAQWLHIPESKRSTGDNSRIKGVMNRLGWSGPDPLYFEGKRARGYRRPA